MALIVDNPEIEYTNYWVEGTLQLYIYNTEKSLYIFNGTNIISINKPNFLPIITRHRETITIPSISYTKPRVRIR
jgi:hypothetical protein